MQRDDSDETRFSSAGQERQDPAAGRAVSRGRYRLGVLLGQGGMATVVEAEDAWLKRTVAVKRLRPELRGDAEATGRFFEEADVMAALDHPGTLPVHDAGVLETGEPFYAMAKVRGKTLDALIGADLALGLRLNMTLVDVFQRVCETMAYAHAQRIIHRDLKPENVMVDEFGAVHVMDWGIAKRMGAAEDLSRTLAGTVLGTPAYMSPEAASGLAHAADARSDVFALGVILYQILTGDRPFHGSGLTEIVERVRHHDPPAPRRVNLQVPRELSAICMKALAKDPACRYASAGELADDIRRARAFLPVSAAPPRLRDRVRNWTRRHPRHTMAIAIVAGAVLLAGAVLGYAVLRRTLVLQATWDAYQQTAVRQQTLEEEADRLRADLARMPEGPERLAGAYREAEVQRQLEFARNDASATLGAMIGLSGFRPEARVIEAMTTRFRATVRDAEARGDWVAIRALCTSRLALLEQLGDRNPIPPEEMGYIKATRDRADAEIASRIRSGVPPGQ